MSVQKIYFGNTGARVDGGNITIIINGIKITSRNYSSDTIPFDTITCNNETIWVKEVYMNSYFSEGKTANDFSITLNAGTYSVILIGCGGAVKYGEGVTSAIDINKKDVLGRYYYNYYCARTVCSGKAGAFFKGTFTINSPTEFIINIKDKNTDGDRQSCFTSLVSKDNSIRIYVEPGTIATIPANKDDKPTHDDETKTYKLSYTIPAQVLKTTDYTSNTVTLEYEQVNNDYDDNYISLTYNKGYDVKYKSSMQPEYGNTYYHPNASIIVGTTPVYYGAGEGNGTTEYNTAGCIKIEKI